MLIWLDGIDGFPLRDFVTGLPLNNFHNRTVFSRLFTYSIIDIITIILYLLHHIELKKRGTNNALSYIRINISRYFSSFDQIIRQVDTFPVLISNQNYSSQYNPIIIQFYLPQTFSPIFILNSNSTCIIYSRYKTLKIIRVKWYFL